MKLPVLCLIVGFVSPWRSACVDSVDSAAPQRPAEFTFADFDFWWDLGVLDWTKRCAKYNDEKNNGVQTRITGGSLAEPHMFPYQVGLLLLRAPKVYQCGGALISRRYVLSAAHCLFRSTFGKVYLGSTDYANVATSVAVYNVTADDMLVHEQYVHRGGYDDIGLVRLPALAPLSEKVQIIPLARSFMTQSTLEGETVTASGWGRIGDDDDEEGELNVLLYFIDVPVMKQVECACYYLPGLVRRRNHICTDGKSGRGTCDGDSGGPLTYFYKNQSYLVGITAFGSAGGCEIEFPSVYTRIATYLDWIKKRTDMKNV